MKRIPGLGNPAFRRFLATRLLRAADGRGLIVGMTRLSAALLLSWHGLAGLATAGANPPLEWIEVSADGTGFIRAESHGAFRPWGVNYDHNDNTGSLIEDYWKEEWEVVVEDFGEIKALGANTVRIHLQFGKFMVSPEEPDMENLDRLAKLVRLAETTGLYLDLTGLGCYHKDDVPSWYDVLEENQRWAAQARFWEAVAETCRASPAVFCYDLMNEPVLAGNNAETEWLLGELGGKFFVQRITLDLAGRTREEVAKAWVDTLVEAIRKHDDRHLVTVGVIPWALTFPKAKPLFYSEDVGANLDFVSVHFYPRKGEVAKALAALKAYDIGKPVVVEETFPLHCTADELEEFIATASKEIADGWISFYWGKTAGEYDRDADLPGAIKGAWLKRFKALSAQRNR